MREGALHLAIVPEPIERRSRFYRDELAPALHLQTRDVAILRDLFLLRFVPAQALYLSAYVHTPTPRPVVGRNTPTEKETGMRNVARRMAALWSSGYTGRFMLRSSMYLNTSPWFTYVIEDGKANELARTHQHYRHVAGDVWDGIVERAALVRDRVLDTLAQLGIECDTARAVLHNNTDLALKLVSGQSSDVGHRVLASTVLAILFFAARQTGHTVGHLLPDGAVDLSFDEYVLDKAGRRERDSHGNEKTKSVPIKPDFFFAIDRDGYALEAETGTSSRAKIEQKVQRYLKLHKAFGVEGVRSAVGAPDLTSFRVLFHCAQATHAAMIADVISRACPRGTGLFLLSEAADLHLGDVPNGEQWTRDHFLKNLATAGGVALYDHLAAALTSPLYTQVVGRASNVAETTRVTLV
jgi:hypothetical protein